MQFQPPRAFASLTVALLLVAGCPRQDATEAATDHVVAPPAAIQTPVALFALRALDGDPAAGAERAAACASCHGETGNNADAATPKLAGQRAEYLVKQLQDFAEGRRDHGEGTSGLAPLTGKARDDVAVFYAETLRSAARGNPRVARAGKLLFYEGRPADGLAPCASCHEAGGRGRIGVMPGGFPAVAAQHPSYAAAQLHAFRSGTRTNDEWSTMRHVAERLSDDDITAVSEYMAGLSPSGVVEPKLLDH